MKAMKEIYIKISVILLNMMLFSSCATLFNSPTVKVKIYSDTDSVSVKINNAPFWHELPESFDVVRSNNSLKITAQKDTIQRHIEIRNRISATYWFGNLLSPYIIFGYLYDLTNPKRFTYPQTILINFDNQNIQYQTWLNPQQNLLDIKVAYIGGNQKVNDYSFRFSGITAGFDYYFTDKYYLNMNFGRLAYSSSYYDDIDYIRSSASYENIQIGSYYKRLHYDAGIHLKRTTLENFIHKNNKQNHLGFAFSSYYKLSKSFDIGLNYYPSFLVLENSPKLDYSHLLFLNLSLRFEAYRPSK